MIRNKRKAKKDVAKYYICTECNADGVGERGGWNEKEISSHSSLLLITYYPSNENALAHVDSKRSGVKKKRDNLVSGSFVLFHYDAPAGFWLYFHYISSLTSDTSALLCLAVSFCSLQADLIQLILIFFPPYFLFRYEWITVLCFERIFQKEKLSCPSHQPKWPRHSRLNCVEKKKKWEKLMVERRVNRQQCLTSQQRWSSATTHTHTRRRRRRDEEEIDCRLLVHAWVGISQLTHSYAVDIQLSTRKYCINQFLASCRAEPIFQISWQECR